ncbi:MAG: alpha/beta fold hydrolase [Limisphaerales bacterium]
MQLYFKEFGRGEPLIILHGLFGSSDNWLGLAQKFAVKFHIFVLDLRNHGRSPHSDEMNYSLMAGDVVEFLDGQKIESTNVLGHSLGGKVAMQFALNFPARVKKLIVADMAPRVNPPEQERIFSALLALDLKLFQSRGQIENALAPGIPELSIRQFLLKSLGLDSSGALFWKMNLRSLAQNYPRLCEAVTVGISFTKPALFLRGGKSNYILESDFPLIQKLFTRAKIETIPEARHWLHADAPEEFARRVLEFLDWCECGTKKLQEKT